MIAWNHHVMSDPGLASIIQRGIRNFDALDGLEKVQFGHCFYAFFKGFETLYIRHLTAD